MESINRKLIVVVLAVLVIVGSAIGYNIWRSPAYEDFNPSDIVSISTSHSHTLFVLSDGSLWGIGDGEYRQLGVKSGDRLLSFKNPKDGHRFTKRPIRILDDVVSAEAGEGFSLALRNDGSLWDFGHNVNSELGVDTGATNEQPGTPPVKLMDNVRAISNGGGSYFLVSQEDDSLWGFGVNVHGQLGIRKNTGSWVPLAEPERVLDNVNSMYVGYFNSFVKTNNEKLLVFGSNTQGELGFPPSERINFVPQELDKSVSYVAAAETHTLMLGDDGVVYGCGNNDYGQLGIDQDQAHRPLPVFDNVRSIAVGTAHSLLLRQDGTLWGMGSNAQGQLGDLGVDRLNVPTKIFDGVRGVYASGTHTLILTENGDLIGLGSNQAGQLGTFGS